MHNHEYTFMVRKILKFLSRCVWLRVSVENLLERFVLANFTYRAKLNSILYYKHGKFHQLVQITIHINTNRTMLSMRAV